MRKDVKYSSPYGREGGNSVPRVNLANAAKLAARMQPFETSTCYGRWVPQVQTDRSMETIRAEILGQAKPIPRNYVVYTGTMDSQQGIPLFLFDEDAQQWFECEGILYGRMTTQARRRMRPEGGAIRVDEGLIKLILYYGYRYVAKCRLQRTDGKRHWHDELRAFMQIARKMPVNIVVWSNKK